MTARWLQSHRTLARLFVRGPVKAWVSRRVWAEIERDPAFMAGIQQGMRDIAAGRTYVYDGDATPSPTWQPDDPVQPEGWHHDGTKWVRTGYSYSPTDDERRAADLLRDKGWRVDEPPCPDCRGLGYTGGYWGAQSAERCPRRCAIPAMYL